MNFYMCIDTRCCAEPGLNQLSDDTSPYFFNRLVYKELDEYFLISLAEKNKLVAGGVICSWHGKPLRVKREV